MKIPQFLVISLIVASLMTALLGLVSSVGMLLEVESIELLWPWLYFFLAWHCLLALANWIIFLKPEPTTIPTQNPVFPSNMNDLPRGQHQYNTTANNYQPVTNQPTVSHPTIQHTPQQIHQQLQNRGPRVPQPQQIETPTTNNQYLNQPTQQHPTPNTYTNTQPKQQSTPSSFANDSFTLPEVLKND